MTLEIGRSPAQIPKRFAHFRSRPISYLRVKMTDDVWAPRQRTTRDTVPSEAADLRMTPCAHLRHQQALPRTRTTRRSPSIRTCHILFERVHERI
jgi:hypothetical protein